MSFKFPDEGPLAHVSSSEMTFDAIPSTVVPIMPMMMPNTETIQQPITKPLEEMYHYDEILFSVNLKQYLVFEKAPKRPVKTVKMAAQ